MIFRVCAVLMSLSLPQLSIAQDKIPEFDVSKLVGEWCGQTEKHGYSWRHIVRKDGTYSTRFASLSDTTSLSETPYWQHGTWSNIGNRLSEMALRENDEGGPPIYLFPPSIYHYEVAKLTSQERHLYYADWDTTFHSTRCADFVGS